MFRLRYGPSERGRCKRRPSPVAPLGDEVKDPGAPPRDAPPSDTTRSGIAVGILAAPSPDAMGLIDARGGGFPDTMWQGSQSDTALHLIAQLPHRYVVLSARRLARRFLLSAAPPPPDRAGTAAAGNAPGGALLQAQIAALAAMGDWTDALALIDLVPRRTSGRRRCYMRTRIDGLLIEDKIDNARRGAGLALSEKPDAYWQKIQVLCQFAADHGAAAGLTLDLLREQGNEDHGFLWAVEEIQGTIAPPPSDLIGADGAVPALTLALLRRSWRGDLPSPLAESDDPDGADGCGPNPRWRKSPLSRHLRRRCDVRPPRALPRNPRQQNRSKRGGIRGSEARIRDRRAWPMAAGFVDPAILRAVYGKGRDKA